MIATFTELDCLCAGHLCDGDTFDCEECGRETPICRGVGDEPRECDECQSKMFVA